MLSGLSITTILLLFVVITLILHLIVFSFNFRSKNAWTKIGYLSIIVALLSIISITIENRIELSKRGIEHTNNRINFWGYPLDSSRYNIL